MRFLNTVIFLVSLGFLFIIPTTDPDFGWHLRYGQDFLQTGQLHLQNNYSYFLPNYLWGYSTFIYDALLAIIFKYAGFFGVALALGILMLLLSALFFWYFRKSRTVPISIILFVILTFSIFKLGFRPQILALLFFLAILILIKGIYKQPSSLILHLAIWLLIVLWVNTHPSFILGVFFYALFCIFQIAQKNYRFLLPFFIVWFVPFINFFKGRVYLELFNHYRTDLSTLIAEWTAPADWIKIFILVSFILTAASLFKHKRKWFALNIYFLSCLFVLAILAVDAKRHVPLYALLLIFVWEDRQLLNKFLTSLKMPIRLLNLSITVLLVLGAVGSIQELSQIKDYHYWYTTHTPVKLPYQPAKIIPSHIRHLYTMYEWGGYLIWQVPNTKVFVDGRMPAWITKSGKSPYTIYLEIIQARSGWEKTLNTYRTDAIFIKEGTFLDLELVKTKNPNWQPLYRQNGAVLYVKNFN